jgi:hypothetical protein
MGTEPHVVGTAVASEGTQGARNPGVACRVLGSPWQHVEPFRAASFGSERRGRRDALGLWGHRFFDALVKDLLPVDRKVAARAATLRGERISLRMPDALILATADLHEGIDTIVCADDAWPKVKGLSCKVELLKPVPKSRKTSKRAG